MRVHPLFAAAAAALLAAGSAAAAPSPLAQDDSGSAPAAAPADSGSGSGSAAAPAKPKRKPRKKKKSKADEQAEALKKAEEAKKAEAEKAAADAAQRAADDKAAAEAAAKKAADDAAAAEAAAKQAAEPPAPSSAVIKEPEAPVVTPSEPQAPVVTPSAPAAGSGSAAEPAAPGEDVEAPTIAHDAVTHVLRGKSLKMEAHVTDPSGVFQVVLYLRKQGMADYIPLKFNADKVAMGQYSVEVPTALVSVPLEYYIEAYDNAGNGPSRSGSPERPHQIALDEPPPPEVPKIVVKEDKPAGQPPAITHSALGKAYKGKGIEIPARIRGATGVGSPEVKWRHLGDDEWLSLPMGKIGGDQYSATIPASQAGKDIEYYLQATDSNGNGPGFSGGPEAPYLIRVEDEPPPQPKEVAKNEPPKPRLPAMVPAPFSPNPGRTAAYLTLTAALAGLTFAGGEAYAAWQANENYQHTFKYEGRNDLSLLKRANDYGDRAKLFAIVGGAATAVAIVLLIVFPEHPDMIPNPALHGSGGDGVTIFKF